MTRAVETKTHAVSPALITGPAGAAAATGAAGVWAVAKTAKPKKLRDHQNTLRNFISRSLLEVLTKKRQKLRKTNRIYNFVTYLKS